MDDFCRYQNAKTLSLYNAKLDKVCPCKWNHRCAYLNTFPSPPPLPPPLTKPLRFFPVTKMQKSYRYIMPNWTKFAVVIGIRPCCRRHPCHHRHHCHHHWPKSLLELHHEKITNKGGFRRPEKSHKGRHHPCHHRRHCHHHWPNSYDFFPGRRKPPLLVWLYLG